MLLEPGAELADRIIESQNLGNSNPYLWGAVLSCCAYQAENTGE